MNMAVLLVTTPVLVRGLGDSGFGIFVTITALTAYLAMSDLGIGAGLLTVLGGAAGKNDRQEMAKIVTSSGWILLVAGTAVLLLGVGFSWVVDVPRLLGAPPGDRVEALLAYQIFVVGLAVGIPLSLGARVQSSLQQGGEAAAWLSLSTSLSAAAAAGVAWSTGSLVPTMSASVCALILVGLLQSARVLRQHQWIYEHGIHFRRSDARQLTSSSGWLFILQLTAVVAFQTDILIVAAVLGSDQAAIFHGTLRAFSLVSLATTALVAQYWPATAEAIAADDHEWVRRIHRRLVWQLPGLVGLAGLFLIAFGQRLIGWWLGDSLVPSLSLLIALAAWTTYSSFVLPYTYVLNAAGILKPQVAFLVPMAAVNFALSLGLARAIGTPGPPLGSLLAHSIVALIPTLLLAHRTLQIGLAHSERASG